MDSKQETEIEPFYDDKLDRKKSADFLTSYLIGRHAVSASVPANESFVLNVNAEWGLGKTYFLTEWAKSLRELGHPVVYFDAWANDYSANPLVGFMAEIEAQLVKHLTVKENIKKQARSLFKTGAKLIRASAPTVALAVVKNFSGLDAGTLADIVKESAIEAVSEVRRDLEKENKNVKQAIAEFKNAFEQFSIAVQGDDTIKLPIFLMVDELDRCRPTYAIELLENIKHIFRVPNVYTIVATDSEQLAHSVKAIYGDRFDSIKYLRRFFDHESRLDNPDYVLLASAILEKRGMSSDKNLVNPLAQSYSHDANAELIAAVAKALKVTTRDLERSIDIIDSIKLTQPGPFELFLLSFLTMLYVSHSTIFDAYERDRGASAGSHISTKLLDHGDGRVTFKEFKGESDSYRGQTPDNASVIRWAILYLDQLWSEKPFEGERQWLGLSYAIVNLRNIPNIIVRLRNYGNLISMAGHFSM